MRDPTLILDAGELVPFLAQARQSGAHAMRLPTRRRSQIADRGTLRPLQQSKDRRLLALPYQHCQRGYLRGLGRLDYPCRGTRRGPPLRVDRAGGFASFRHGLSLLGSGAAQLGAVTAISPAGGAGWG